MVNSGDVLAAGVFVLGLAVGSFLNVCIRRIPAGESVVRPASRCPRCLALIRPYDNIPVLSYLLLQGRCRACRHPISSLYPAVELLTAGFFLLCFRAFGLTLESVKWMLFGSLILVLVFTDVFERLLPDVVNFTGLAAGLLLSFFVRLRDGSAAWLSGKLFGLSPPAPVLSLADALLGAALGSGLLWVVAEGYFRLRGREGMGLGDVKMMAMAGSFFGVKKTLLMLLLGSLAGTVVGSATVAGLYAAGWKTRVAERASRAGLGSVRRLRCALAMRYLLPFGTFLGLAALGVALYGTPILAWYSAYWGLP